MTCCECIDRLMDYRSGEITPAERRAYEEHLTLCRDCLVYLWSYDDTIRITKETFQDAVDIPSSAPPEEWVRALLRKVKRGFSH